MNARTPAEVFPPGEFLREELEARNWTQADLADVLGRPARLVNELIAGKRSVTPETARGLSDALGTSAELWMNLESAWQLSKVHLESDAVSRRARLYGKFPVKEMVRRGWIDASQSLDILESRFLNFFELGSLDKAPVTAFVFRKTEGTESPTVLQLAFLYRAKQLAKQQAVPAFTESRLARCFGELRGLLASPEEIRKVPRILAEAGIRFVLVEQLAGSKVDGVCFWFDKTSPVIALSMRFDRIDYFWFTLLHELRHIANKDGLGKGFKAVFDVDLVGDDADADGLSPVEIRANAEAAEFLIPSDEITNFMHRVRPLYYEHHIVGFANRIHVHAGIVVGRLHKLQEIRYSVMRKHLVKVRHFLADGALVDGWGQPAPQIV